MNPAMILWKMELLYPYPYYKKKSVKDEKRTSEIKKTIDLVV